MKNGRDYWKHVNHTCTLRRHGTWADVKHPDACSGRCAAGGTANVRFFYPTLEGDMGGDADTISWANSMLEDEEAEDPNFLKGYWVKKRGERSANEVLGSIGPEVAVAESLQGSRIRMLVDGQAVYRATALQLIGAGHPLFN
jgi:hypothetical protein